MGLSSTRLRPRAQAAVAVGVVLIVGLGVSMFLGGSSSSDTSAGKDKRGRAEAFVPSTTGTVGGGGSLDESGAASGTGDLASLTGAGAGADDPFANTQGDKTVHRVSISFASDEAMYAGYRFRNGGEGLKVADGTLSVSRDVRRPLPVAQTAVQVLGTATYATCTIAGDGVVDTRQTACEENHVVVCIG